MFSDEKRDKEEKCVLQHQRDTLSLNYTTYRTDECSIYLLSIYSPLGQSDVAPPKYH